MHPVEAYLTAIRDVFFANVGLPEPSHYAALASLLDAAGADFKPRVRCIGQLSDIGAGVPDFGLFTAEQLGRGTAPQAPGQPPARGVVEAKGPNVDLDAAADSTQVRDYVQRYGTVLLTNYWDFRLLERDEHGDPLLVEEFRLAESAADFAQALAHPRKLANEQGDLLLEFLKRALLHGAPLTRPRDLAWFLASYARDALKRLEAEADLPALATVRDALEEALGVKFEGEKGEHFFRSTLVQTLFYGLFSAWVLWHGEDEERTDRFDWRLSAHFLHLPVIQALYYQLASPYTLGKLGMADALERSGDVLNRVHRPAFFAAFEREHAVQYFYEPFLEAYDPALRKTLGVWYTPPEVVRYMVARVHTVLQEHLGLPDGLADESVLVLDPCCGTGAFLVETLRVIAETLRAKGGSGLAAGEVRKAALERVFGFEILPAPFVVSHLQLGLFLQQLGAPLVEEKQQRAQVYLTNALTGWEPPDKVKTGFQYSLSGMPELQAERDAARAVKQEAKILVVIGNPPYNGFAGMAIGEERDLSDAYRTTERAPAPQGHGLNDLYVRFYRVAERRIVEQTGEGIVCFISNYSWLDGLSHTGMREHYLDVFDRISVDCLNGDKYKTGKLTPEGDPDPSIFSTELNREGIQVGTSIALLLRHEEHAPAPTVSFRHLWGQNKLAQLAAEAEGHRADDYEMILPRVELGLPFTPVTVDDDYLSWPLLPELFPVSFPGVKTSRDEALVDIDRERLEERMKRYFDPALSHEAVRALVPALMAPSARFSPVAVREALLKRGYRPEGMVRYCYRPFDVRWLYWEPETKLLDEKREEYVDRVPTGTLTLAACQRNRRRYDPPLATQRLAALHIIEWSANLFPLLVRPETRAGAMGSAPGTGGIALSNVSQGAIEYLKVGDSSEESLFLHTLAVMHAPAYAGENSGALRQDWPRIPLPADRDLLLASAALGRQVAALLDTETPVPGVTTGTIRPELDPIAVPERVGGGHLLPERGDLDVTAGWGHGGRGGVTMPGRGRLMSRAYTPAEAAALGEGRALLGEDTLDVYLNDVAYWRNVPRKAWEYTIGGYQVMKKWLSYREKALLGRGLRPEEVREVQHMARRIAALLLLGPALDENYRAVKEKTYEWPGEGRT